MKAHIGIITNAVPHSGVGVRAYEIARRIEKSGDISAPLIVLDGEKNSLEISGNTVKKISPWPGIFGSKSISWIRLARHLPDFDVYDISNQTLSFIAKKKRPSIVTVHDIIELTNPQDPNARPLNAYLLGGITNASRIIAVSEYTKRSLMSYFRVSEDSITVIPNGVGVEYKKIPNFRSTIGYRQLIRELGVGDDRPVIVSVGSEHPRKNMKTVLRVLASLKKEFPNILLIKVGNPGILSGRREVLSLIDELKLQDNVKLVGNISTERINDLYNIATCLLFPSRHEGFGLPPLEAMASGCPVVCSNATSLPEIVGDAAILHDPDDVAGFTASISKLVHNDVRAREYSDKGIQQSKKFSWDAAARAMEVVYRDLL
jgi:glycosyltransferase involved in cell wall biosynthesis